MINLLPPQEKQNLILEKKEKLASVLGVVILVSLICFVLILMGIKYYFLSEVDAEKEVLNNARQKYQTAEFLNYEGIVKKYNGLSAQLSSFYGQEEYFSDALKVISSVSRPQGLYLTGISMDREQSAKIKVSVAGVSNSRDNLLLYKNNIEADKRIENSGFSPESWVAPKNVNFNLTFEISKNGN